MAADLQPIVDQVTAIEGVVPSAIALINNMAAYILANKNDPAAIQAYAARMQAQAKALADAVAANPLPQ